MTARFKAPQKKPSSAMTDSADKRSMKADRCADSRREALAPAGKMHYYGQAQLSGLNRPSALCHATTLTSHSESQGPSNPYLTPSTEHCIPALKHSQAGLLHKLTGAEIIISQQFPDILTMCKGMQGCTKWRIPDR